MAAYFGTDEALRKLKRFYSFEFDLLRHTIGFIPKVPGFAEKCCMVRHSYEDFKRTRALRERVQDFGIPIPEKQIQEMWTNVVRHVMTAPDHNVFIAALYGVVKPAQVEVYRRYVNSTLRLNDAPSVEAIDDHLRVLENQVIWGKQYLEAGQINPEQEQQIQTFASAIRHHIAKIGGLYDSPPENLDLSGIDPFPEYAIPVDMELDPAFVWRSAERIFEPVHEEAEHLSHHSYTHFTELPVIDICAAIVYDGRHMPFEYIADFIRQTWDEVRHSQMGFSRLRSMGINPYEVPIPVGHYRAYCGVPLMERIAALTQVGEACSFVPKREWVKSAIAQGDTLTALEHDFDMVDEKNHVKFGSRWLKELLQMSGDTRDFQQVVSDAEWMVRGIVNELKKEKGEKWQEDLGPRFTACAETYSPLNLAPRVIIA